MDDLALANFSKIACCFSVTMTLAAFPGMAILSEEDGQNEQPPPNRLLKQDQLVLVALGSLGSGAGEVIEWL